MTQNGLKYLLNMFLKSVMKMKAHFDPQPQPHNVKMFFLFEGFPFKDYCSSNKQKDNHKTLVISIIQNFSIISKPYCQKQRIENRTTLIMIQ